MTALLFEWRHQEGNRYSIPPTGNNSTFPQPVMGTHVAVTVAVLGVVVMRLRVLQRLILGKTPPKESHSKVEPIHYIQIKKIIYNKNNKTLL